MEKAYEAQFRYRKGKKYKYTHSLRQIRELVQKAGGTLTGVLVEYDVSALRTKMSNMRIPVDPVVTVEGGQVIVTDSVRQRYKLIEYKQGRTRKLLIIELKRK